MSKTIDLNGDLVVHNANSLDERADDLLSSGGDARRVEGNTKDPAATFLTSLLRARSTSVAHQLENIATFVRDNAAALRNAVNTLQARDQLTAEEAASTAATIDTLAATPAPTGTAAGATTSGAAGAHGAFRAI